MTRPADPAGPANSAELAARVIAAYARDGARIAVAESCTGGLLSVALTAVSGASAVFERGWITYSNQAKQEELGVAAERLAAYGAVSGETACAMAEGALAKAKVQVALAITGIAGPAGGTPEKPVGLVYLSLARQGGGAPTVERQQFTGDRQAIRQATIERALALLFAAAPSARGNP